MTKTLRAVAGAVAALLIMALFAVSAQAAPIAGHGDPGNWDLVFASLAGLAILGIAGGVIYYAAKHRDAER